MPRMNKTTLHLRRALCLLALPTCLSAHAAGTVEVSFSTGWLSGSVSGLASPWPFGFTLEGSFAEQSSATIVFGDDGVPTLTVTPASPSSSKRYVLEFAAGGTTPMVAMSEGAFRMPLLQTFDGAGKVVQSAWANGAAPALGQATDGGITSNVPEPATGMLLLGGLGLLAWLARGRVVAAPAVQRRQARAS